MKKIKLLIYSLVLTFIYQPAQSETVSEMLMYCEKSDGDFFRGYCHQYIAGVIDVQATFGLVTEKETIFTCFPQSITARQGAAIFVKWANSNPESHRLYAHQGVIASLHKAFPCPKK